MVTDFEAAWAKLGEYVATKTQHGREGLLVAMQEIAADCRVPAGELARLLRLYGVEVERARRELDRDEAEPFAAGPSSAADADLPDHHDPTGGHDGRRKDTAAVVG